MHVEWYGQSAFRLSGDGMLRSASSRGASWTAGLSLLSLNTFWDALQQVLNSSICVEECSSHSTVDL